MVRKIESVAAAMGAKVTGTIPEVGGGAFGAERIARILSERLAPSRGLRPGRPSNREWVKRPKVPMSEETFSVLVQFADEISRRQGRKVSPMQLAAQILEEGVSSLAENTANQI